MLVKPWHLVVAALSPLCPPAAAVVIGADMVGTMTENIERFGDKHEGLLVRSTPTKLAADADRIFNQKGPI